MYLTALLFLAFAANLKVRYNIHTKFTCKLYIYYVQNQLTDAYPITMCRTIYFGNPNDRNPEEYFQPWPQQHIDNEWPPREPQPYYMEPNRQPAYYVEPMRPRMPSRPCPSSTQQQPIINRVPASQVPNSQPPSTIASSESSKIDLIMGKMIELLQKIVRKLYPEDEKSVNSVTKPVNGTSTA